MLKKQIYARLNKHYKKNFGEDDADEWHVDPAPNQWEFERDGETITLTCDAETGKIKEEIQCKH